MEEWKWIEGYEGLYEISNKGRVRTHNIYRKGEYLSMTRFNKDGYLRYSLRKDGKSKEFAAARLVAIHFIGHPDNKELTVNHIDGQKDNNDVENLEWCTRSEQMIHAYAIGLKKPIKGCKILDKRDIEEIKRVYVKGKRGYSALALGRKYNVSATTIERIVGARLN